jgi:putative transposase
MKLNDAGSMIERWYRELKNKFPDIQCDAFVCMPNHVHFIVVNVGADLRVRPDAVELTPAGGEHLGGEHLGGEHLGGEHTGSPLRTVVQWFMTMTTNEYIRGVKQQGWTPFPGKLWQRNYWEHILRNESEFNRIRIYLQNNPARNGKWTPRTIRRQL